MAKKGVVLLLKSTPKMIGQIMNWLMKVYRSNSHHDEQMPKMGSVIQDIHRDFGKVRENFDSWDIIIPLLKDLAKQKEIVKGGYFVESYNHGHGHSNVHPSNFEDGVSVEFKKAFQKVELPTFGGSDPIRWIAKAEKFFEIQSTKLKVKVYLAFICMERVIVHWFSEIENPYEQLAGLRQTGWIEEIVQQFEMSLAQLDKVPKKLALGFFINGLNGVIRKKMRTHDPQIVTRAIHLARRVENEIYGESMSFGRESVGFGQSIVFGNTLINLDVNGRQDSRPNHLQNGNNSYIPSTSSVASNATNSQFRNRGNNTYLTKSMSGGEKRGIVFNVTNNLGHSIEFDGVELVESSPNNDYQGPTTKGNMLNLPFFSLNGFSRPKTMKMKGIVGDDLVMVMVDSGTSYNFIYQSMVHRLGLPIIETKVFMVKLGDKH
ncbi:hypothetical protein CR513_53197, partial [Mucuna pruriens]